MNICVVTRDYPLSVDQLHGRNKGFTEMYGATIYNFISYNQNHHHLLCNFHSFCIIPHYVYFMFTILSSLTTKQQLSFNNFLSITFFQSPSSLFTSTFSTSTIDSINSSLTYNQAILCTFTNTMHFQSTLSMFRILSLHT